MPQVIGREKYKLFAFFVVCPCMLTGRPLVGIIKDITERKYMEEELLKSQKLKSINYLAGGIAHDFNNILTAIS